MFPSYFVFVNKKNCVWKSLDLLLNIILAYKESLPKKSVCGGGGGQLQVISLFYIKLSKRKLPREKVGASTPPPLDAA